MAVSPDELSMLEVKPNKYHHLECCEWTRGINRLLAHYAQDRDLITTLMLEDPDQLIATIWKADGPLAIDNECRCQMGNGQKRSPFACAQCKNLRRLIDFQLGGIEKSFQIECGELAGSSLIVSSSEINSPFLAWDGECSSKSSILCSTVSQSNHLWNSECLSTRMHHWRFFHDSNFNCLDDFSIFSRTGITSLSTLTHCLRLSRRRLFSL